MKNVIEVDFRRNSRKLNKNNYRAERAAKQAMRASTTPEKWEAFCREMLSEKPKAV